VSRLAGDTVTFVFEHFRLNGAGDRGCDLILQLEQIGELAIVCLGHEVMACVGLDKLY
jgi:hypothetical protein